MSEKTAQDAARKHQEEVKRDFLNVTPQGAVIASYMGIMRDAVLIAAQAQLSFMAGVAWQAKQRRRK